MRVMFVEPPKDFWFIMGEYVPPPFGLLCLAGYLEETYPLAEVELVDSQAEGLDWDGLRRRIEDYSPDVVAPSGMATANAYYAIRVAELAKNVVPSSHTVLGGQHFTALADETLVDYPFVDIIVRGEGEAPLFHLVKALDSGSGLETVAGVSYRHGSAIVHNPDVGLVCELDTLPHPAYHHVAQHMKDYYFSLMGGEGKPFAIVEGSRGCHHNCSYCSQWRFWKQSHRVKSPERVVDEFEHLHTEYGSKFFWFSDDNFGMGPWTEAICDGLAERGLGDEIEWFCQIRVDDIVEHPEVLSKMRRAGATWVLVGFDNPSQEILHSYRRRGVTEPRSRRAVKLLKENSVFSQGTFIIGHRSDTHESVAAVRHYADELDPDIASFFVLTPFPGTEVYEEAVRDGWIDDHNWAHYDMVHAIMPTEHMTRMEVQQELYDCYESFFGSWPRRYRGISSSNPITRRTYGYLAKQALLTGLKNLIG